MFIMAKGISLIIYNAIAMDNGIVEWFIKLLSKELKKEEFREEILKPLVKSLISYIMPYVFFIIVINIFLIILTLSGVMYFINPKR
jgi:predicted branched-subunit amino acid permease